MAKFEAHEVALQLVRSVGKLLPRIKRHNAKLAQQVADAVCSVPANFAEGAHRQGRDRLYLYNVAGGSAAEVRTHLVVAAALGYLPEADTVEAERLADRAVAMAWRLTHPRR